MAPNRQHVVRALLIVLEHGGNHILRLTGLEQGEERMFRPVRIPQREHGIVRKPFSLMQFMVEQASSRSQASSACARRVSKDFPSASARRFFKAPVVPVADRATLTVNSGESAVSNLNQATSFRPAISGKSFMRAYRP